MTPLARLEAAHRQHLEGRSFDSPGEMKTALEALRPTLGGKVLTRLLSDVDEVERAGAFASFQTNDRLGAGAGQAGANAKQARLLGNVGPGPLALIATSKKGAAEVGPMAQAIRDLATYAFPEHAAQSLSILARAKSARLGAPDVPPFELGPTLSEMADAGRFIVGRPEESTGLGRFASWDLDGRIVISPEALKLAKSNPALAQLAILRAVLGLKITDDKIDKLAERRSVTAAQHYEIRYTVTGFEARAAAGPLADHLAKILAPALGMSAGDVESPQLPRLEGAAYYPGGSNDNKALEGVHALFPGVTRFLYVDPGYEKTQTGRPDTAPELTVTLARGDATNFDVQSTLGGKAQVGVFACPGDWAFLMQVPEFVANTVHAIDVGCMLVNSTAWQYRPPLYNLPVELLGLSRIASFSGDIAEYECFRKTEDKDRAAMTLAIDVDRCLAILASLMGGTHTPVRGDDAGEGTLVKKAASLNLRFRSEAWPDFLKEIDARVRGSGDPALEQAYLDFLAKVIESPADGTVQRTVRAWIRSRISEHERVEPTAVLTEPLDATPKRSLDFPSVRYEEFGMGILVEAFKPTDDLIDRLIGRMQSGEASLDAKTFALVLEKSDAGTAQKEAWTARATPFFVEARAEKRYEFELEVAK